MMRQPKLLIAAAALATGLAPAAGRALGQRSPAEPEPAVKQAASSGVRGGLGTPGDSLSGHLLLTSRIQPQAGLRGGPGTAAGILMSIDTWRPVPRVAAPSFGLSTSGLAARLRRWTDVEEIRQGARRAALNRALGRQLTRPESGAARSRRTLRLLRWLRFEAARPEPPAPPETVFTERGAWARERLR